MADDLAPPAPGPAERDRDDATRLQRLLRPRSLALIGGAVECGRVARQNRALGFEGPIWPVHPSAQQIAGEPALRRVADLPEPPDAAFVAVPAAACASVIADLAAIGCGGAVVYSSGFAELGEDGAAAQLGLVQAAGSMPMVGPNCYGLVNYADRVLLWPDEHGGSPLSPGRRGVALVSQSSSLAVSLTMVRTGLPLASVVAVGNGAQTTVTQLALAQLSADNVSAVGLLLESIADIRGIEQLGRASRALGVPVVALLLGRSEPAQQAVRTHTASLACTPAISAGFLQRNGIGQVTSLDGLLGALCLLHCGGPLGGTALTSLSCSGGEAALIADAVDGSRAHFPPLTATQHAELSVALGPRVPLSNPLDYHTYVWADIEAMEVAFTAMLRGPADLNLLFADVPRIDRCSSADYLAAITAFEGALAATGARGALVAAVAANLTGEPATTLVERGVPVLAPPSVMVEAVEAAATIGTSWATAVQEPVSGPRSDTGSLVALAEADGKSLLRAGGIAVPAGAQCRTAEEAVRVASGLDGALIVVKGQGSAHKSDDDAVRLGLRGVDAVRAAAQELLTRCPTVLVEQQVGDAVAEILVGVHDDPVVGAVLTVGAGGVATELLDDVRHLVLPVGADKVRQALLQLRCAGLLTGHRGRPAGDLDALVAVAQAVAGLATSRREVVSIEVNPVLVTPDSAVAVDALVVCLDGWAGDRDSTEQEHHG